MHQINKKLSRGLGIGFSVWRAEALFPQVLKRSSYTGKGQPSIQLQEGYFGIMKCHPCAACFHMNHRGTKKLTVVSIMLREFSTYCGHV